MKEWNYLDKLRKYRDSSDDCPQTVLDEIATLESCLKWKKGVGKGSGKRSRVCRVCGARTKPYRKKCGKCMKRGVYENADRSDH